MVIITVGQGNEAKDFIVAREYLISVSDYFVNAFNRSFREAADKKISLADVDSTTFGIFIEWLHSRVLVDKNGEKYDAEKDGEKEEENNVLKFMQLLDLYIFGDEYDVSQFRRDVIDIFIKYQVKSPSLPPCSTIQQAYERLPASSPLLQFLVDCWTFYYGGQDIANIKYDLLPRQFLMDTMTEVCRAHHGEKRKNPYTSPCDYHEHDGKTTEEVKTAG